MIAYTIHLQTEYEMRDFERALALREVVGVLLQAQVPHFVTLYVGPKLAQVTHGYGRLTEASPFLIQPVEQMPAHQVCFLSPVEVPAGMLRDLAYVRRVERLCRSGHEEIVPTQVYINRLPKLLRNGTTSLFATEALETVSCNKREHSYLSHSFHTYKGKYYPQLVGALLNWCGVEAGDWVLEPFAGSGTTLVECSLRGVNSIGVDLNPLARLISDVKVRAISEPYEAVERGCRAILASLRDGIAAHIREDDRLLDQFLPENRDYLCEWFPAETLADINACLRAIRGCGDEAARGICLLTLSDNLREVSLQDPESLRILRRKTPPPPSNLLERMVRGVEKRLAALEVQRYLYANLRPEPCTANVLAGDARRVGTVLQDGGFGDLRFKAIITSPPYATALPYIDTDRLSLFAVGLLQKGERNELEWAMIGNREISDARRRALEEELAGNMRGLPDSVLEPIRAIHRGNIEADSGFRRRNMGALLYKYFADMQETFAQARGVLSEGAYYVVVIGNSTTKVGEAVVDVLTGDWLTEVAVAQGFRHVESFPMTDQVGYMRHSRNMIKTETIIVLQNPLH